jgi:hypothetical protein
MLRLEALKFALAAPEFKDPSDQALIQDQIDTREPKAPRVKKEVKVKATKKQALSLDSIKSRKRKVSADDVLAAVDQTTE